MRDAANVVGVESVAEAVWWKRCKTTPEFSFSRESRIYPAATLFPDPAYELIRDSVHCCCDVQVICATYLVVPESTVSDCHLSTSTPRKQDDLESIRMCHLSSGREMVE